MVRGAKVPVAVNDPGELVQMRTDTSGFSVPGLCVREKCLTGNSDQVSRPVR